MNPNEILDYCLELIYQSGEIGDIFSFDVFKKIFDDKMAESITNDGLNQTNTTSIDPSINKAEVLDKLIEDGYLTTIEQHAFNRSIGFYFKKTFKGRWFINQLGYEKESDTVQANLDRERDFQTIQMQLLNEQNNTSAKQADIVSRQTSLMQEQTKIQNRVRTLTKWIAIGTIIAAVYYMIQIIDYTVKLFHPVVFP